MLSLSKYPIGTLFKDREGSVVKLVNRFFTLSNPPVISGFQFCVKKLNNDTMYYVNELGRMYDDMKSLGDLVSLYKKEGDMKNDTFYLVWRDKGNNPMAKYDSREKALEKAKEAAKNHNRPYYVVKPIAKVEVETTITTKTIDMEE